MSAEVGTEAIAGTLSRLAACGAADVDRARTRIDEVLAPLEGSKWPEVAQRFSDLTNTGFPLEFAWTSRDSAIRWTAEVAPPETPNRLRLHLAGDVAFGGEDPPRERLVCIARLQSTLPMRFGAWLGMRHKESGEEPKVYAELPEVRPADLTDAIGVPEHPVLRTVGLRSRMAGVLSDGSLELYTRSMELDEQAVQGLEASMFGTRDTLWPAVRGLVGGARLPRPSGVSIAFGPDGVPLAVTWFSFAKALFSSDAATVSALASRTDSQASRSLLDALAGGAPDGRWRCGMVGVGVAREGAAWYQVGIRPSP